MYTDIYLGFLCCASPPVSGDSAVVSLLFYPQVLVTFLEEKPKKKGSSVNSSSSTIRIAFRRRRLSSVCVNAAAAARPINSPWDTQYSWKSEELQDWFRRLATTGNSRSSLIFCISGTGLLEYLLLASFLPLFLAILFLHVQPDFGARRVYNRKIRGHIHWTVQHKYRARRVLRARKRRIEEHLESRFCLPLDCVFSPEFFL
ncbi:hypothetical protein HAX54_001380 [Datura stramonium]|uniref:Uncharacterized protein n=1 Tax=Datura stramonium TaxID=4076 RepID=A0ABS8WTK9_DATST|nr:hypothetical protein [Datura stramonium]